MIPSFRWFGAADPVPLAYIRQIPGVTGVVSALYDVPVGDAWGRARLGTLKAQIEAILALNPTNGGDPLPS